MLIEFPQSKSSSADARHPLPGRASDKASTAAPLPKAPLTLDDTGLPQTFLVELLAKLMLQFGLTRLTEIAQHLCLPSMVADTLCQFMRRDGLLEVARRGAQEADVQYELTQVGRARATDWLRRNAYVGPAPVTLGDYSAQVKAQAVNGRHLTAVEMAAAFDDVVVPAPLLERLGVGINAGRPLLLYGPSGSGKTYLAHHLHRLLGGVIVVPHALLVHGEVVRVFDPQVHTPVKSAPQATTALDNRQRHDTRWVMCERPLVTAGGELTLEMLDLTFDARAGYYEAPPHFKANNGLFIVDDLGRQRITPQALMNRWIVPMERRYDHLMLRNGGKFTAPFDQVLVFSTNLRPDELADAAFLRRLGSKIEVGALALGDYRRVFDLACQRYDIDSTDEGWASWLEQLAAHGQTMLATQPFDLLELVNSRARYLSVAPTLNSEAVAWAFSAYFATDRLHTPLSK